MKKYSTILQVGLRHVMAYPEVNIIYLLLSLINIFLTITIWTVAFQNPNFRSPESYATYISYFFIILIINQLAQSFAGEQIAKDLIKQGDLSNYLLKPMSLFGYLILTELPYRLVQCVLSVPAVGLMFFIFRGDITFNGIYLFIFFFTFWIYYLLSFLIQYAFAALAFWFDDTQGIMSVLEILTLLFTGIGFPIFFFPPLLKSISSLLPFQYTLYFPVTMILNRLSSSEMITGVAFMIMWLFIMVVMSKYLWKFGLKKYTGEGR